MLLCARRSADRALVLRKWNKRVALQHSSMQSTDNVVSLDDAGLRQPSADGVTTQFGIGLSVEQKSRYTQTHAVSRQCYNNADYYMHILCIIDRYCCLVLEISIRALAAGKIEASPLRQILMLCADRYVRMGMP